MSVPRELATGLGGAIGCDYRRDPNYLILVEFDGKISRVDLVRALDHVVFSGTATMPADSSLDLTNGTSAQGGDIRWDHTDPSGGHVMRPQGNCELANLGVINYNSITHATLQDLAYSNASIHGDAGPSNQLVTGDVFGVHNRFVQSAADFDYAKVQVLSYGANLQVRWATYRLRPRYQVLGIGYTQPEDIAVCSDERYAYVTERTGNLLRADLTNANRAAATVVSTGMTAPHQIALDEDHNQAYVVEYANPGRLLRIDLANGAQTVLINTLENAIGLLVTQDLRFVYVSEQTSGPDSGRVSRFTLSTGHREVLVTGMTNPFFMRWSDPGEGGILIAERDPANRISLINLTETPPTVTHVALGVPFRPSSVAVVSPERLLICSDTEVNELNLTSSVYVPTGPMLLGIGHVPVSNISRHSPVDPNVDGYADTSVDPNYFFQVKDSPFGGTLPLMFNHERAYNEGARFYKILVDGVEPRQTWYDYQWSTPDNKFMLRTIAPSASGFYPVRSPGQLWYNHWLGYLLDTAGLSNGLHTISVRLFATMSNATEIGSASASGRSMVAQIDNRWPSVSIDQILHDGSVVGTCAIVDSGSDAFTFNITAQDAEEHLLSWTLTAHWGDNKSKAVDGDNYNNHVSPTKKWAGITGTVPVVVPSPWHATVAGDTTSTQCAHTFYLGVWDRVINGWNYIHYAQYHKSITLMLP